MASKSILDDTTYRVLFDNTGDAILLWRRDEASEELKIIEANRTACDRYRYTRDEFIKLIPADLYTAESLGRGETALLTRLDADHLIAEVIHVTSEGREIPTEISATRFVLHGNAVVLSVCRDISRRKEIEAHREELLKRETGLRAKYEAEIDMRTNYMRALVHELKTPLTSLVASSDYLVSHLKEEPLLSFAKNINFGANSVNHRIDELHDLIKIEMGTLKLDFYPVNMRQLLIELADFVKPNAERSELTFRLELPTRLPRVWGDKERLQQVIMNLLNNAFKYTPKKGAVCLKTYTRQGELIVEVQDTGCGISESAQKDLFQPYQHRDPSQQRTDGLGLGLVITKAIVERYKGKIRVESELGRGSRFFVALPTIKRGSRHEGTDR
jgi:PAS domain S-box-containing protein